ncbi:MAG TPA: hypothetical protein VJ743_18365 [Albitalea sp.]|nr:hypothetical protein [Albitalea sp.]
MRLSAKNVLALLSCFFCTALLAQSPPQFSLRDDAQTARAIRDVIARSQHIPFDKRYADLSSEQKDGLRSLYKDMGPADEPPFPRDGLAPLVRLLQKGQSKMLVTGPLYLIVDVSAEGEAEAVKAIGSPSPEMTQFAASVMLLTKYKPALCAGTPCKQQYPFALQFDVR